MRGHTGVRCSVNSVPRFLLKLMGFLRPRQETRTVREAFWRGEEGPWAWNKNHFRLKQPMWGLLPLQSTPGPFKRASQHGYCEDGMFSGARKINSWQWDQWAARKPQTRIPQHHTIDVLSWTILCGALSIVGASTHKIGTAPPSVTTKKVTKRSACWEPQP